MMYSTAARMSSSVAEALPPLGGMGYLPVITDAVNVSTPCAISGAQAALSPIFGFIILWQPAQVLSNTALPSAGRTISAECQCRNYSS